MQTSKVADIERLTLARTAPVGEQQKRPNNVAGSPVFVDDEFGHTRKNFADSFLFRSAAERGVGAAGSASPVWFSIRSNQQRSPQVVRCRDVLSEMIDYDHRALDSDASKITTRGTGTDVQDPPLRQGQDLEPVASSRFQRAIPKPGGCAVTEPESKGVDGRPGPARFRFVALALVVILATVAAACGNSGPSEGALQGKSPTAIASKSIVAYHQQRSVGYVTKTITGHMTTVEVGAISSTGPAAETVTTNGHPVIDARLVGDVAYVRAVASILQQGLGLPASTATAYAGKWISLKQGDAAYERVVNTLSTTQAIIEFVPEEPHLRVAGVTSVAGHNAVVISGSPNGSLQAGSTATTSLFVSTTAPYLPLSGALVVKNANGRTTERSVAAYGKWNERVDPSPPKGATPVSSLSG
jgi:hypothetical protein